MNLEQWFKDNEEKFLKSGPNGRWHETYHAIYTFFYNNHIKTNTNVHIRDGVDTKRYMILVIIALIPALFFGIFNAGYQARLSVGLSVDDYMAVILAGATLVLPLVAVSYGVGLAIEFVFASVRGHAINEGFLVSGLLYPLILPVTIPLWQAGLGIAFGVIVGKEVFGGTGRNFLNPALTARCFVFFTYPSQMSGEIWTGILNAKDQIVDGFSTATPLAVVAYAEKGADGMKVLEDAGFSLSNLIIGLVPGSVGETSVIAILLGAGVLLFTGVGSWRTMLSALIGALFVGYLFNTFGDKSSAFLTLPPLWHLAMGSFAFAVVFMATDPVSSPTNNGAKLIYGFLIGCMGMVIRVMNPAYPEGWMLSILLMNVFAPLIDHLVMVYKKSKRIPNLV
jgi:Na+-transporting NADH:ubiquinone oxidoreductase subunit B